MALLSRLLELWSLRYAPADDEKQAAFTGREQRRGVWILPFLFAGLFDCGAPVGGRRAQAAATDSSPAPQQAVPSTAGSHDGNARDEAAQRLLRSLCNADGSLSGEDDSTGGDGDEVAEQQAAAAGATKRFDWNRYRETFPDTPPHAAITAMFAEYALLVGRISRHLGHAAVTSMTLTEAAAIDEQAR